MFAAAALLLAGCSKEPATPDAGQENRAALSFSYKNYRGAATYAATVPALAAEKAVYDMDIFACSDGRFVRALVAGTDYTETVAGEVTTLEMTPAFIGEFAGQRLTFYFVANNASSVGGKHIASFAGTQQLFEDTRTSPLGDSPWYAPGTKAELICTVDDFSGDTHGLLMTARSAEILIAGKHTENIVLKRRMARFDIENPAPSTYAINMIYVSGARVQASLFAASSADHSGIATRSLEEIYGPNAGQYGADKIAPCVFYLYPTDLATTTIVLEVANLAQNPVTTALFELDATQIVNKRIEANSRYIIFFDENTLEVGLRPGDWNNGNNP